MRGTSKSWRLATSLLCVCLLLGLLAVVSGHHRDVNPGCHICKLCHFPVVDTAVPPVVAPSLLAAALDVPFEVRLIQHERWSSSAPRSPPLQSEGPQL